MDADKIIKALECHKDETNSCEECAYDDGRGCSLRLAADTLSIIKELQAENEALKLINSTYVAETSIIRKIAFEEFAMNLKNKADKFSGIDKDFLYTEIDGFETYLSIADVIEHLSKFVINEMTGVEDNGNTEKDS